MLQLDIITIFPSMLDSYIKESILARAQKRGLIKITTHNLRDYASDKHKMVDDRPFGGGAGMVLKVEPIFKALMALKKQKTKNKKQKTKILLLSAKGKQFTHEMARRFSKLDRIIFICGRYEGVDERVAEYIADEEISIGPYVLTGGELPSMVVIDAVSRHISGVLGNEESLKEESFVPYSKLQAKGQKSGVGVRKLEIAQAEYPHYTRPEIFKPKKGVRWSVPKILLSGDHQRISKWRKAARS
ncbi:MAG: tRNA (guanosine(37)-N1)-methyltransferase TrmD [bacterium]|nr:tRNA (guanosine(37)-N1)-methyltransferase TrmD [bacterium]